MVSIPRFIAKTPQVQGVNPRVDPELAGRVASVTLKGTGEAFTTAGKAVGGFTGFAKQVEEARANNRAKEIISDADLQIQKNNAQIQRDARDSAEFEKRSRKSSQTIQQEARKAASAENRLVQQFVTQRLKGIDRKNQIEIQSGTLKRQVSEELARFGNVTAQLKQRIVGAPNSVEADLATADLRDHIRSNTGTIITAENAAKLLRSSLQDVNFQRGLVLAQDNPTKILSDIRAGKGIANSLDPEQQRKLQVFAESREAMLTNRRLAEEKRKEREINQLRDQVSIGLFQQVVQGKDISGTLLRIGPSLGFKRLKEMTNINKDMVESRIGGNKTDPNTFKRVKEAVEFGFDPLTGDPTSLEFVRKFRDNFSAKDYGALLTSLRGRQDRVAAQGEKQRDRDMKDGLGIIKNALGIDALGLRRDETKDFLLLEATRQFRERTAADPDADPIQVAREVAFTAALAVGKRLRVRTEVVARSTGYFTDKLELDKERLAKDVNAGVVTRRFALELEQLARFLKARDELQQKAATNAQVNEEDVNKSGWVSDGFERANKLWRSLQEKLRK
jgi:hypothetical protein